MPVSQTLQRLLRIRHLEEEQRRQELATAMGKLNILESALACSAARSREARKLAEGGMTSGNLIDRQAGMVESRNALHCAATLQRWISASRKQVEQVRGEWLNKRVERKQTETLVDAEHAQRVAEATRQVQQSLDQSHLARRTRKGLRQTADSPAVLYDLEGDENGCL